MFERFTRSARAAVTRAGKERAALAHDAVDTEHLLLALLFDEQAGLGHEILAGAGLRYEPVRAEIVRRTTSKGMTDADADALRSIGIDLDAVRARLEESFGPAALHAAATRPGRGRFRRRDGFSPRARKVLELSLRNAILLHHRELGAEHLVLGLLHEKDGLGGQILWSSGLTLDGVRERVRAARAQAA